MTIVLAFAAALFRLAGFFVEPLLGDADIHAVAGEPSRVRWTLGDERPLTVATWNIERGEKFDEIAAVLEAIDADVLLLQEVDRVCARSANRDVASDLAVRLRMNWVSAAEFQEIGEGGRGKACVTGQAILSRWPIENAAAIRFADQASAKWTFNPVQPRRGGRIALRATTGGLVVFSLHLESGHGSEALRVRQLAEVRREASRFGLEHVVIGGDFNNAGGVTSELLSLLRESGFSRIDAGGPPARRPIDWVFIRGLGGHASVVRTDGASDHDPIVACLRQRARHGQQPCPGGGKLLSLRANP